jgi:hypothetical protein
MTQIHANHVALLVRSVDRTAALLSKYGFDIGPAENWEGEGTKEIYVERRLGNSLLVMEPVKPGAYERAMAKRGPGLHHFAIDVANLDDFLTSISGSGWLLHPSSVKTISATRTAYLARPGFPALIEVQEKKEITPKQPLVTRVELNFPREHQTLVQAIGLAEIVLPAEHAASIRLGSKVFSIQALCEGSREALL